MGRRVDFASLAADPLPDSEPPAPPKTAGVTELPIEKIAPNPLNQRTEVDEDPEELERMANTIREHGLLQPLVVCTVATFVGRYPDQKDALGEARWGRPDREPAPARGPCRWAHPSACCGERRAH